MIRNNKTVYIAGKIKNNDNYVEDFKKGEEQLRKLKYTKILNPAVLNFNIDYEQYMPICFAMIDVSDNVYFLKNWMDSEGAKREMSYALAKKKTIMYEEDVK